MTIRTSTTKRDPSAGSQPVIDSTEHQRVCAVVRGRQVHQDLPPKPPARRTVQPASILRRGRK